MKKAIITGVALGAFALTAGLAIQTTSIGTNTVAQAKTYSFDSSSDGESFAVYYTKPTKKNAYIWNMSHSKRVHNLKNYKNTIWKVQKAWIRKGSIYYQIQSSANSKVTGMVWNGYLTRAITKAPNMFSTDASYTNYIKTASSQRLARAILKLFPNTPVSVDLSQSFEKVTATKPFANSNYTNFIDISSLTKSNPTSPFNNSISSYLNSTALEPVTGRIATVTQILNDNGYTAAKRASLSDYVLGIRITDETTYITNDKNSQYTYSGTTISKYPQSGEGGGMMYDIYLAQKK